MWLDLGGGGRLQGKPGKARISGLQEAPPPTRAWSRSRFHSLPDRFYICVGRDRIDLSDRDSNHFQIPEG